MKSTTQCSESPRTHARRFAFFAAASLLLAPCLLAQTTTPTSKEPVAADETDPGKGDGFRFVHSGNSTDKEGKGVRLFTMKFDGGRMPKLCDSLRKAVPEDSIVMNDSLEWTELPGFELRNVRLSEIGRTIEFLTEGRLKVEIVDSDNAAIWRFGRTNPAEAAVSVKTRSVAAPHLFADDEKLKEILDSAEQIEMGRLEANAVTRGAGGSFRGAEARPLKSQGIFVIIGDEDGVAGLESLIKAAEQRLVDAEAEKLAGLMRDVPKSKAVAAPHLFGNETRFNKFIEETRVMNGELEDMTDYMWKTAGLPAKSVLYWVTVHPRKEQKVFLLLGAGDAILGMESLIKAAEQLAEEEDAKIDAEMKAERAAKEAAQKEAELQDAKDRAKADKREQ